MEAGALGVQGHPLPGLQENQSQNKTMEGRKEASIVARTLFQLTNSYSPSPVPSLVPSEGKCRIGRSPFFCSQLCRIVLELRPSLSGPSSAKVLALTSSGPHSLPGTGLSLFLVPFLMKAQRKRNTPLMNESPGHISSSFPL